MAYGQIDSDKINTSVANTSIGAGNATRFKNRIINGNMRIDQRNAGASVTIGSTISTYILDRFFVQSINASKFSVQQNAGSITPPSGFTNYLGITSLATTSSASGDYYALFQAIEGLNAADLSFGTANAKTVTLSFWVRSSLTGTFGGSLKNADDSRTYPFNYTISSANTWTQISITIAGDTTGTWLTTNGKGINVCWNLGVGSTYLSSSANSWQSANYYGVTGNTSVVGTSGATFYITGVQLEVGSSATGFEYVDYTTQLAMCQRYARYVPFGTIGYSASGEIIGFFPTYVPMRASPTSSLTSGSVICDNGQANTTSASPAIQSGVYNPDGARLFINGFSGLSASVVWPLASANRILLSAEL